MSPAMARYREWEQRLITLRTTTMGRYSPEEDRIVDEMTAAWEALTPAEQDTLDAEGPRAPNHLAGEQVAAPGSLSGWPSPATVKPRFIDERFAQGVMTYASRVVYHGLARWSAPINLEAQRVREAACT